MGSVLDPKSMNIINALSGTSLVARIWFRLSCCRLSTSKITVVAAAAVVTVAMTTTRHETGGNQ